MGSLCTLPTRGAGADGQLAGSRLAVAPMFTWVRRAGGQQLTLMACGGQTE